MYELSYNVAQQIEGWGGVIVSITLDHLIQFLLKSLIWSALSTWVITTTEARLMVLQYLPVLVPWYRSYVHFCFIPGKENILPNPFHIIRLNLS